MLFVRDPRTSRRHGGAVGFRVVPSLAKLIVQLHDLKSGLGQGVVNCRIDLWISTFEPETPDTNAPTRRLCRLCRRIFGAESVLQKFHSYNGVINISCHRTNRIEMLRLERVDT